MRKIIRRLILDAEANGDQIMTGTKALIWSTFFSPGFQLLQTHRLAHWAHGKGIFGRITARLLCNAGINMYGSHICVEANIGNGLRMSHPVSIVIGGSTTIGENVTVLQGVTLGQTNKSPNGKNPCICDGASIFAGAVIIGGIRVGKNAFVGANSVVLQDVPDNATAVGIPARIIKKENITEVNTK